jgi:hypothetical protein
VCVSLCVCLCVCVCGGGLRSGVAPRPSYFVLGAEPKNPRDGFRRGPSVGGVLGAEPKNPRDGSRRGPAVGGGAPPAVFFVAGWGPENPLMDERAQRQVHRALYKFSIPPDCQGGSKMLAGPAEATLRGDNISAPPGNQEGGISVLEGPCFLMP